MTSIQSALAEDIPQVLPGILKQAAERFPDHGLGFVQPDRTIRFTPFPQLLEEANGILAALQSYGLKKGDKVIFSLDTAEEIIPLIWACFFGGIIPALLQPPISFTEYSPAAEKAERVFALLGQPFIITSPDYLPKWHSGNIPADLLIDRKSLIGDSSRAIHAHMLPSDLAMIQFSSGSTGVPKGVMLSHRNIIINTTDIISGIQLQPDDVLINWMPLYHDMGLIGFHFTPSKRGVTQYLINPIDFVKNPYLWLDVMSEKKCSIAGCPNFGQVLVNRYLGRKPSHEWDFSALRILFNGAEPISVPTMNNFMDGLRPFGFNPVAMFPVYGLAEATLAVSFSDRLKEAEVIRFNRMKLIANGHAEPADALENSAIELVNLGRHLDHCSVLIVDDFGDSVGECCVGHVHVRGENITTGYYSEPNVTARSFDGEWLITGDLGFIFRGDLYITGRSKDIIFINGINYYAHDLETIAHQVEGVMAGKIITTGYFDEVKGHDKLLIFLVGTENESTSNICKQLKSHFSTTIGLIPDVFIPVRSNDIPRTSSGKIQRYKLVGRYLNNEFTPLLL